MLRDASTYDVCQEFVRRTKAYVESLERYRPLAVFVYGDATGESRRSAASRTDWQIVRDFFSTKAGEYKAIFNVSSRNPEVKDRINCVNGIISNAKRERRLTVSPKCKQLIRNLEPRSSVIFCLFSPTDLELLNACFTAAEQDKMTHG